MAMDRMKQLFGWGEGTYGCLGLGDGRKKSIPVSIQFFQDKTVLDVGCGDNFTVVIAEVTGDPMHRPDRNFGTLLKGSPFLQGG